MIKIEIDQAAVKRVQEKLTRLQRNADPEGKVFQIAWRYADAYKRVIVNTMGKVSGESGGDPGIQYYGMGQSVQWAPLSASTLEDKEDAGLSLDIWEATGATKSAVNVWSVPLARGSKQIFAGISKSKNETEYLRALEVEYGGGAGWDPDVTSSQTSGRNSLGDYGGDTTGGYPERALFTLTNELFRRNHDKILTALRSALLEGVNWGSR